MPRAGCDAAVACVIAAASLWGIIGIFTRSLGDSGLNPIQITWVRCCITAAGMLAMLLAFDRKLLRISVRDAWMFVGTGLLSISMFSILYFTAAELATLSVAAVLLYTAPSFVVVMSAVLFKERITRRKALALVAAFIGCVLTSGILGGAAGVSAAGIAAGIGSGFGYALYSIFGKFALRKYHPFTVTLYTFLVAAICILPFSCLPEIASAAAMPRNLGIMAALGIVSTLIPYFLYTYGLNRMEAGKASVLAFAEPMVATLAGFAFFGETPGISGMAGIALILASVILLSLEPKAGRAVHNRTQHTCAHVSPEIGSDPGGRGRPGHSPGHMRIRFRRPSVRKRGHCRGRNRTMRSGWLRFLGNRGILRADFRGVCREGCLGELGGLRPDSHRSRIHRHSAAAPEVRSRQEDGECADRKEHRPQIRHRKRLPGMQDRTRSGSGFLPELRPQIREADLTAVLCADY